MNILVLLTPQERRSRDVLESWYYSRDPALSRVAKRRAVRSG